MAILIIALFVIVVVWGWYMVPKKTGAHKSSTLNVRGRQFKSRSQRPRAQPSSGVTVVPAAAASPTRVAAVPSGPVSNASARRRRIMIGLATAALVAAAAAFYTGSASWWWVHVAFDGCLIMYYGLTLQLQQSRSALIAPVASRSPAESRPPLRQVVGG